MSNFTIVDYGNFCLLEIFGKRSKRIDYIAVDFEDVPKLLEYTLSCNKQGYVKCKKPKEKQEFLHRIVITPVPGFVVDHINQNPRDNRKSNLRLLKHWQNISNQRISKRNKSGCTGVHFDKSYGVWKAKITVNGKIIRLGDRHSKNEAILLRKEAEVKYRGFN